MIKCINNFKPKCDELLDSRLTIIVPSEDVQNGVLVRKTKYVVVDSAKELLQYQSSDFSVSNLMAIGSNLLNTGFFGLNTDFTVIDSFDNFNLSGYEKAQTN